MSMVHVHLMLNHIPVLGAFAILALVLVAVFKASESIARLALQLMVFVGLVSLVVFFTGEPTEEAVEHISGISKGLIDSHEDFATYSLICTEVLGAIGLIGLFSMRRYPEKILNYWRFVALIALINVGLMAVTANFGGQIRHTEIQK